MPKLRLLLRSVYLKGQIDARSKTSDMSWEDKIVNDIKKLIPSEGEIVGVITHSYLEYKKSSSQGEDNILSHYAINFIANSFRTELLKRLEG